MVKQTHKIRRKLRLTKLSVSEHFLGLGLKGLIQYFYNGIVKESDFQTAST